MRELCEERLKNLAINDRAESSHRIKKLLKSEIIYVLKNYFNVTGESVDIDISIDGSGKYNITISASASVLRLVRLFAD